MRLHYTLPNRLAMLADEIQAAVPTLRPVPGGTPLPDGRPTLQPVMRVEGRGDDVWLEVPDDTSQADLDTIAAVVVAHDPTRETAQDALRRQIVTTAASAGGVRLDALTAAQRNTLLAVLLWQAGGVADDLTVKPLKEWV